MWAKAINIILGLWIMISPAIFPFNLLMADYNHITGPLIITFSITALWEINRNAKWLNVLVGILLIVATLIIQPGTMMVLVSNLFAAILVIILLFVKEKKKINYGGGWRSLFQKNPPHVKAAAIDSSINN
jgi:hypothetical protein